MLISFKNCQTQYRQRHIQSPIKDFKILQKQLTVPEAYSEWSETSKMKLLEKFSAIHYFSHSLFTRKAPSSIFDSILNTPLELLTIFAKGSTLKFDWVLDTPLTCSKKYKNCKKSVKELYLETLQLRLRNNF